MRMMMLNQRSLSLCSHSSPTTRATKIPMHRSFSSVSSRRPFAMRIAASSSGSRKRSRTVLLALAAAVTLPAAAGFSSGTLAAARSSSSSSSLAASPVTDEMIAERTPWAFAPSTRTRDRIDYLEEQVEYEDDLFEDEGDWDMEASVSEFQRLQKSTGSEILPTELQQQIDEAADAPVKFVLKQDASDMEKRAMSSIPEQLPQAAVQALTRKQKKKDKTAKKVYKDNLFFSKDRVTPEQEIELARTVQRGAALYRTKHDAEQEAGRTISKQEWADAAGLTAKELRRRVSDYRRAKHNLVTANLGLVHAVVKQFGRGSMSHEELVQEGSLGLLRAAELFDPDKGLRFSTYAVVWIKGTLQNTHASELVRLPAREKTRWNKIRQATADLKAAAAGGPESGAVSPEQVARATGLTVEQVVATQRQMMSAQRVMSLDVSQQRQSRSGGEDGGGVTLQETATPKALTETEDAELAERTQLQADLIAAMARNLDEREARLLRLRYGLSDGVPRTLQECAEAMGISYSRARQLSVRCLKKLREAAEAKSLEEYLLTIA